MANYKCIVTLENGGHKTVRMTRDIVAHVVSEFKKELLRRERKKRELFRSVRETFKILVCGVEIVLNDVAALLFINEKTGERLEIA